MVSVLHPTESSMRTVLLSAVLASVGLSAFVGEAHAWGKGDRKEKVEAEEVPTHSGILWLGSLSVVPGQSVGFQFRQSCYREVSAPYVQKSVCAAPVLDTESAWLAPYIVSYEPVPAGSGEPTDRIATLEIPVPSLVKQFRLTRPLPEEIKIYVGPKLEFDAPHREEPTVGVVKVDYQRLAELKKEYDNGTLSPAETSKLETKTLPTVISQLWPAERSDLDGGMVWRGMTSEGAMSNLPSGSHVCFDPEVMTSTDLPKTAVGPLSTNVSLQPSAHCWRAEGTVSFKLSPTAPLGVQFGEVVVVVPRIDDSWRRVLRVPPLDFRDREVVTMYEAALKSAKVGSAVDLNQVAAEATRVRDNVYVTLSSTDIKDLFGS